LTEDIQGEAEVVSVDHPTAVVVKDGIRINFSDFYACGDSDYEFFGMKRKRNFNAASQRSADILNGLMDDKLFALGILSLRYDMTLPGDGGYYLDDATFAERLYDLFDEPVAEKIRASVGAAYTEAEVDIDTAHGGRNEELQFTNEHAIVILQWSCACVAASPLITAYMECRDVGSKDVITLLMNCFGALLRRFEVAGGPTDILMKIRKLVESRVLQTRYSDKVMWYQLRNLATDPMIYVDRLNRKFIVEGIPKLRQGTNIIKFFHVFLRFQLTIQFTGKFTVTFRPVRQDSGEGDSINQMERLETELTRRDEGAAVLSEIYCAYAIRDAAVRLRNHPSEADVAHWSKLLRGSGINAWQRGMVTKFFLPSIGRVESIKTRTLGEYTRMFLITRRWLEENNYPALYDYMGGRISEGMDGRKLVTRKRFVKDFQESAQYQELLGGRYSLSTQAIIDSGVIIDMISAVHVSVFETLPSIGEDPALFRPRDIQHRIETVAQEALRFIMDTSRPQD
jgi:hypothetical protein